MNMTSGSHYDFLYFLGRDHKKITCTLVSDTAGMNHTCEVHTGRMVQCSAVAYCGGVWGVQTPPESLKALHNHAKLNPTVKTIKNY